MAQRNDNRGERPSLGRDGVIELPPELEAELACPPMHQPWTAREEAIMAQHYKRFSSARKLRALVDAWQSLTGTVRTKGSLRRKAEEMQL